jgi:hypothetical protein
LPEFALGLGKEEGKSNFEDIDEDDVNDENDESGRMTDEEDDITLMEG